MAEPDNFEEDLFADLCVLLRNITPFLSILTYLRSYTEDDPPAKQEPAPEVKPEVLPPVQPNTEMKEAQESGTGEQQQAYGGDEEDDEIDFNLGGNTNENGNGGSGYGAPVSSYHESQGPGIKEDG